MAATARARTTLRDATRADHDRVDALFSTARLDERDGYARFLVAQAAAHLPVERALEAGGIARVIDDWPARQRGDALASDLAALEYAVPAPAGDLALAGEPQLLGALYVLEGSRLGGAMLKRAVPDHLPSSFLDRVDSGAWRGLIVLLDDRLRDDATVAAAVAAARQVFALFETAARRHLATTGLSAIHSR